MYATHINNISSTWLNDTEGGKWNINFKEMNRHPIRSIYMKKNNFPLIVPCISSLKLIEGNKVNNMTAHSINIASYH